MLSTSYRCVLIYPLIKGERERVKSGGSILQNEIRPAFPVSIKE